MNKKKVIKKDAFVLSVDSNIVEVLEHYPEAIEVFIKNELPCVGCSMAQFEKISDIIGEFGIDGEKLIEEIELTAKEKR